MYLRPDGKKAYQVLLDPQLLEGIKEAKRNGLNLQPLLRDFIKEVLSKTKNNAGQKKQE